MNEATIDAPPRTDAETMARLMGEYTRKLQSVIGEDRAIQQNLDQLDTYWNAWFGRTRRYWALRDDREELVRLLRAIKEPAFMLARHVSQMVEHGRMDELTRIELRLRLAEFEHALESAKPLFSRALN